MTKHATHTETSHTMTMKAITQDRDGTSEVLRLDRVPRPVIGDNEVLIEVRAAGLDRGTEHLMTGKPYAARLAIGLRKPKEPGARPRRRGHRGGDRAPRSPDSPSVTRSTGSPRLLRRVRRRA